MTIPGLSRILFVDDQLTIRKVVQLTLGKNTNYELLVCESGEEALEKAKTFQADLVILDLMMPGLDGLETLERLREIPSYKESPVVFMSAKSASDFDNPESLGIVGFVTKPFDPLRLEEQVAAIYAEWAAQNAS